MGGLIHVVVYLRLEYYLCMAKTIPRKRSDTLVKTIEKKYGVDLGYRSDAELHTVLRREGVPSLSRLLKMIERKES